jgi:aryl-alcohol dehydrogenase-like predicted oxidoreductase
MTSKIILGTVQFGLDYGINNIAGKPSREQVFMMLEYAAKHGIELLDTADAYGTATDLLGEFNSVHSGLFSINTKFKGKQESLSEQLSNSIDLLNLKAINTYFFHSYTDFINYPKLLQELVILKQNNLIGKIGISVYYNSEFITAINIPEVDVIQFPFNLLDNRFQRGELIELAKIKSKELQVRSVFMQGLFFKSLTDLPSKLKPLLPYLERIHEITETAKVSTEQLALSYALQQSEIENVIIGVDTVEQLKKNIEMLKIKISDEIIDEVNKINVKETELLYPKNW